MNKLKRIIESQGGETMLLICFLLSLTFAGCSSDDGPLFPNPTDTDYDKVEMLIFVNKEYLPDASARFIEIPGSDSIRLELYDVYPNDTICMNLATTHDERRRTVFSGEYEVKGQQTSNIYLREISVVNFKVDGYVSGPASSFQPNKVRIDISYTVPDMIANERFLIEFGDNDNEDSGFRPDKSYTRLDSCNFICQRINSEIGRLIKSFCITCRPDGHLTCEYIAADGSSHSRDFRYWLRKDWYFNDVIEIDDAVSFYAFFLEAITPKANLGHLEAIPYQPDGRTAGLVVNKRWSLTTKGITFLDSFRYKIFTYLRFTLPVDFSWTPYEIACFNCIEKKERSDKGVWVFKVDGLN